MKKYLAGLLIALGAVTFLSAGCGEETAPQIEAAAEAEAASDAFPLTIRNYDGAGNPAETTYSKPPEKIIALWQNSVETLLSLGAGDRITAAGGISSASHLTPENQVLYEKIPLRLTHTLSQEAAVALHPDFILGWRFDFTGKANSVGTYDFWRSHGVPVYMTNMDGADYLEKHTVEDELQYILDVGRIVGKAEKARELVHGIEEELSAAASYAKQHPKEQKVLCVFYMDRELHIYTPRTLPGDIVTRLGGTVIGKAAENVGQDEVLSYESLLLEDPDVLFVQSSPEQDEAKLAAVYADARFRELSCVKNKRVYTIPFYTIRDPAVRVGDAIRIMADGLYPERMK